MDDDNPENPRLITFAEAQERYGGGGSSNLSVIDLGIITGADVLAEGGVKTLIPFVAGRMIKEIGYFPGDYAADPDLEIVLATPNVGNPLYGWGAIPNTGDPLTDTIGNVSQGNGILANGKHDYGGMIMDTGPLVAVLHKGQDPGIMAFLPAREWVASTGFVTGEWLIDSNGNIQVNNMAVILTLIGKTPGQTQFGLDTFTEHYKCDASANVVMTATDVPQMGSVHPSYQFMFVTNRYCSETSESASALDLVYTGCLRYVDVEPRVPLLPAQELDTDDQVQSASSSRGVNSWVTLTSPITVQFYAPSNVLSFITYGERGTKGTVADPDSQVAVITTTIGDTTVIFSGATTEAIISQFFTPVIVGSFQSKEIVSGKYWLNTDRKTVSLFPYIFSLPAGFYPVPYNTGTGYALGDSITVSGTGACTMEVTSIYTPIGAIAATTITSNTLSAATGTPISATGGSGSGASYTVIEVT